MTGALRNDREKVLGDLRRRPAVFSDEAAAALQSEASEASESESFSRRFFPGRPGEDAVSRFLRMAEANAASTARAGGMEELPAAAAAWLRERGTTAGADGGLRVVCSGELAGLDWAGAGIAAESRAAADGDAVGVTRAVAAAADTGTLLQTSDGGHSLTVSLLPPLHIAAVAAADVAEDLAGMWAKLFALHPGAPPRAACLISGPSRTADIEQTLVLGAHGPLAVHVVVVG